MEREVFPLEMSNIDMKGAVVPNTVYPTEKSEAVIEERLLLTELNTHGVSCKPDEGKHGFVQLMQIAGKLPRDVEELQLSMIQIFLSQEMLVYPRSEKELILFKISLIFFGSLQVEYCEE